MTLTSYMQDKVKISEDEFVRLPESIRRRMVRMNFLYEKYQEGMRNASGKQARKRAQNKMRHSKNRWKFIRGKVSFWRVWEAAGKKCYICDSPLDFEEATKDHVFPESEGYEGNNNLMPSCKTCNQTKENTYPSVAQIEKACITYDLAGKRFDPKCPEDEKFAAWMEPFKSIGMRYFVGASDGNY